MRSIGRAEAKPGQRGFAGWGWRALVWPALWVSAVALEMAAGGVSVWLAGRHGPALVAVLLNLMAGLRFAATLRRGQVPLITRYARCDERGLPMDCEGYTRALTASWAWLLAGFALLHAGAMLDFWPTGSIALIQGLACTLLFLAEHALRSRVLPQLGLATPWRTLRAIWHFHAG